MNTFQFPAESFFFVIWISQAKCTLNGQRERRGERSLNSKVLWGWGMGWDVEMKMDNVRNCRFDFYQRKYIFNWRENSVWMRGNCFRFSDNLFCHYHPCNTPLCAHILYFHLIGKRNESALMFSFHCISLGGVERKHFSKVWEVRGLKEFRRILEGCHFTHRLGGTILEDKLSI